MGFDWFSQISILMFGGLLLCLMVAAAAAGHRLQRHMRRREPSETTEINQTSFVVSAVLGLLALLMGFTFSLAIDRFDARRLVVLEEANAIGTVYLRAQLLDQPHRGRISDLLVHFLDNRIALAEAMPQDQRRLLAVNDRLVTELWAAQVAAFDSIKTLDISSSSVEAMARLIEIEAKRKAARMARVPAEVFELLFVYIIMSAGFLGYTVRGVRGQIAVGILLFLFALALLVTLDLDQPISGRIQESQAPMEALREKLTAEPPRVFDRWRSADGASGIVHPK